jgi:hypothetical protein
MPVAAMHSGIIVNPPLPQKVAICLTRARLAKWRNFALIRRRPNGMAAGGWDVFAQILGKL